VGKPQSKCAANPQKKQSPTEEQHDKAQADRVGEASTLDAKDSQTGEQGHKTRDKAGYEHAKEQNPDEDQVGG